MTGGDLPSEGELPGFVEAEVGEYGFNGAVPVRPDDVGFRDRHGWAIRHATWRARIPFDLDRLAAITKTTRGRVLDALVVHGRGVR